MDSLQKEMDTNDGVLKGLKVSMVQKDKAIAMEKKGIEETKERIQEQREMNQMYDEEISMRDFMRFEKCQLMKKRIIQKQSTFTE